MSIPANDLPADFAYGYVTGRVILAVGDTADEGTQPDEVAPTGAKAIFTPKATILKSSTGAIVIPKPIECPLDANGYLTDPAGNPGVWLITGTYAVTYTVPGSAIPGHDIVVASTHTLSQPARLVDFLTTGAPVTTTQYAELNSRIDSLATVAKGAEPSDPYPDMLWVPL